jgi:phage gp29-like protein
VDPVKALYAEGVKMQNGGVLAAAHGTLMQLLTSTSEGRAFERKLQQCDLQITLRIHGATRMTQEAKSGSKADSQTAQDVVGLRVKRAKRLLSVMLTELLYNLVKWNKGKAVADKLAPRVTLNPTEQQDWADRATALAALVSSGYLDPSQYAKMDEELNLPPRAAPAVQTPGALGAPPDATADTPAPAPGLPQPMEAAAP